MKLIFSFDDGDQLDVTKMAPLLERYGYRAIFYVPNFFKGRDTLNADQLRDLSNNGHIIGGHTVNHPDDLKLLEGDDLLAQIHGNKIWLESMIDFPVETFCYPRGRHNEETIKKVREAGFLSARTTEVGRTYLGFDPFKMPTTVHVFQRTEYNGVPLLDYFKTKLAEAEAQKDGYMHIWGHSAEIEREDLWKVFEEMLEILRSKKYESIYS